LACGTLITPSYYLNLNPRSLRFIMQNSLSGLKIEI
jgi:hypothetical protein